MQTVTITRPSKITGRPATRTVYVVSDWTTYRGIAQGRPVVIVNHPHGPEQYEVLTPSEAAQVS